MTRILGECGDASDSLGLLAAAAVGRANPALFALVASMQGYINMMRLSGEKAVQNITGLAKNTRSIEVNGRTRIMDFVDPVGRMLHEVKNTYSLNWTQQIRDTWDATRQAGGLYQGYGLTVWHRADVIPSQTMRANAATLGIVLRELPFP